MSSVCISKVPLCSTLPQPIMQHVDSYDSCAKINASIIIMSCFPFQVNSTLFNSITMQLGPVSCNITLKKQTFTCSRVSAKLLQISLETYKLSKESEVIFEELFNCTASEGGCGKPRLSWNSTKESKLLDCFIHQQHDIKPHSLG